MWFILVIIGTLLSLATAVILLIWSESELEEIETYWHEKFKEDRLQALAKASKSSATRKKIVFSIPKESRELAELLGLAEDPVWKEILRESERSASKEQESTQSSSSKSKGTKSPSKKRTGSKTA